MIRQELKDKLIVIDRRLQRIESAVIPRHRETGVGITVLRSVGEVANAVTSSNGLFVYTFTHT